MEAADEMGETMEREIDRLFQNMRNNVEMMQRQNDIMKFTEEMGKKQLKMVEEQKRKSFNPPNVDRDWSPKSVSEANDNFTEITDYAHAKDKEIDDSGTELKKMNDFMIASLNKIFGIEDSGKA